MAKTNPEKITVSVLFVLSLSLAIWLALLHPLSTFLSAGTLIFVLYARRSRLFRTYRTPLLFAFLLALGLVGELLQEPLLHEFPGPLAFEGETQTEHVESRIETELFLAEGADSLQITRTIRLSDTELFELLGAVSVSDTQDFRSTAIDHILEEQDGWELTLNTTEHVEFRASSNLAFGNIDLVGTTDVTISPFPEMTISGYSDDVSRTLAPTESSYVLLRSPCKAAASASAAWSIETCSGNTGEMRWNEDALPRSLELSLVHPFLRSGTGHKFINLTSGQFVAYFFNLLLGLFAKWRLWPIVKGAWHHFKAEPTDSSLLIEGGPDLEIEAEELDIATHERALERFGYRDLEKNASGIYIPSGLASQEKSLDQDQTSEA